MKFSPQSRTLRAACRAAVVVSLALVAPSALASAGGDEPPVTEEQLEYSKQLFGEGEEAMKAKDFPAAVEKYKEAYRYAPHLHLFTYNIAVAAEAANDCKTAHYYYGQFLALVPEHPERKTVERKVERLQVDCPYDQESGEVVTTRSREERDAERAEEERSRAMNDALAELRAGEAMYAAGTKRFPKSKAFKWAAWRKKRDVKRMKKLLSSHGIEDAGSGSPSTDLPDDLGAACKKARAQEKRIIDALGKVIDVFDSRQAYRVASKSLRGAENKDMPRFDACSG